MVVFRREGGVLSCRPLRHLVDLWMVIALYISIKGHTGLLSKGVLWAYGASGAILAFVWVVGRQKNIERAFSILLSDDAPADLSSSSAASSNVVSLSSTDVVNHQANPQSTWRPGWGWWLAGLMLLASLLGLLEWRQPNYFVQDDNLAQFLPVVLHGTRSLVNEGVFPTWNPHQYLGSPTTTIGTYALTYPPTYLSYIIAQYGLGNEFDTLDVFCIAHLLVGYLAMYWACRVYNVRPPVAAAASLCFVLSGFFLIAGRSWYYMTPTALWGPLLFGLVERFRREPVGWKWVLMTGGTLGALFHSGNAQMWCYAIVFYGLAMATLLLCRAVDWQKLLPALSALGLGIAIAMPLLVPQYLETAQLQRRSGDGALLRYLPTLFLPYPLAQADYPGVSESPGIERMGHLYYSGTIFSVMAALGMVALIAYRWRRETLAANVWCILAWVALITAMGRIGGLWYFLAKLPPFTGFKHPFKLVPFATLFMVIGGAVMLERALRHTPRSRRWATSVFGAAALLISYHVWMSTPSFCNYAFRPFPELPAEIAALPKGQPPQRMYAVGPRRSLAPEFASCLMHQWPTVWGWLALDGYDPLVRCGPRFGEVMDRLFLPTSASGLQIELGWKEMGLSEAHHMAPSDSLTRTGMEEFGFWGHEFNIDLPQALRTLRAYGVRWVFVYVGRQIPAITEGNPNEFFWMTDPVAEEIGEEVQEHARLVVRRSDVCIYELQGAAPLAFVARQPQQALPIAFNAAGLTVDTSSLRQGGDIVVNVVYMPRLRAGTGSGAVDAASDKWGRLTVHVPAGTQKLSITYQPPWMLGFILGGGVAAGVFVAMRRYRVSPRAVSESPHETPTLESRGMRRAA